MASIALESQHARIPHNVHIYRDRLGHVSIPPLRTGSVVAALYMSDRLIVCRPSPSPSAGYFSRFWVELVAGVRFWVVYQRPACHMWQKTLVESCSIHTCKLMLYTSRDLARTVDRSCVPSRLCLDRFLHRRRGSVTISQKLTSSNLRANDNWCFDTVPDADSWWLGLSNSKWNRSKRKFERKNGQVLASTYDEREGKRPPGDLWTFFSAAAVSQRLMGIPPKGIRNQRYSDKGIPKPKVFGYQRYSKMKSWF